jgi:peptidoglycan/LPS O-acetylase OafA/YrhL
MRFQEDMLAHDRNHFTLVRWVLASSVIFSHGFDLTLGASGSDPLKPFLGLAVSGLGVDGFFIVSGFLVAMSLTRSRTAAGFIWARVLRIFPGLIVSLLLTVIILGIFFSNQTAAQFFTNPQTLLYIIKNIIPLQNAYDLPGVFANVPFANTVNGSLWTIRFEIYCYAILLFISLIGVWRSNFGLSIFAAVVFSFHIFAELFPIIEDRGFFGNMISSMQRLFPCFLIGMVLYRTRDRLILSWWVALALIAIWVVCAQTPLVHLTRSLALGYILLCSAFLTAGAKAPLAGLPDYSYGIYIYAFPVQQALIAAGVATTALTNIVAGFLVTLALAALSWHLVEKPGLALKKRLAGGALREAAP